MLKMEERITDIRLENYGVADIPLCIPLESTDKDIGQFNFRRGNIATLDQIYNRQEKQRLMWGGQSFRLSGMQI